LAQSFLIEAQLRERAMSLTGGIQDVHFANVDLELESSQDLQPLIDELGSEIRIHYHDRLEDNSDFASVSLTNIESGTYGEPDKTISAFCDLIEGLSSNSRNIWDQSSKREFDIGFESGNTAKTLELRLEKETLRRVVDAGATIEVTIYPIPKA